MPNGKQSYYTTSGAPLVGGRLYTYAAGTSTPKTTWSDAAGTSANTNPVILDSRGEATVFFSGSYKLELRDAANSVIWSVDSFFAADTSTTVADGRTTLPSGTTVELGSTAVRSVDISGTANIQSFGLTAADGAVRFVRFTGAATLVFNGTSMILPGGANITAAVGDTAIFQCLGSGAWVCLAYEATQRFGENDRRATAIASAATTDLGASIGRSLDITGTTTITSFGTAPAGFWRFIRFTGALTLTHNGTSLVLPGARNILTTAGDTCTAISLGSGNWYVAEYQRTQAIAFRAGRSIAQTSGAVLIFDTESFDTVGAYNNITGVFTAPSAGLYQFNAGAQANLTGGPFRIEVGFSINSSSTLLERAITEPGTGTIIGANVSGLFQLAAGDTVDVRPHAGATWTTSIQATVGSYFSGFRVG